MGETGPLSGIRVVELGVVVAGPSAAALMAGLGADVIKVEPPEGDPWRGARVAALFDLDNRSKRSICLNLKSAEARAVLDGLVADADVFVSNVRPSALRRSGFDAESLMARHPSLIYAHISGYGYTGVAADKAGYDVGAFWARSGYVATIVGDGIEPPMPRAGMGDHTTAVTLLAGINAALFDRTRTGRGRFVSTSLMRAGTFVVSSDLSIRLRGDDHVPGVRRVLFNPTLGCYRTSDDRWFFLLGLQFDRHWPVVVRAVGRPELADDPRFTTPRQLVEHLDDAVAELDAVFATRTMSDWADVFALHDVWWDPVQSLDDVIADPVFHDSGALVTTDDGEQVIGLPFDIGDDVPRPTRAPELGEHTETLLLDLGYTWDDISALKETGAIP
ncbi:MAG TPA: CoA transferase [Ilumatobacter sp.]|nr:CoA transferase [Ilumatobacter sp.]